MAATAYPNNITVESLSKKLVEETETQVAELKEEVQDVKAKYDPSAGGNMYSRRMRRGFIKSLGLLKKDSISKIKVFAKSISAGRQINVEHQQRVYNSITKQEAAIEQKQIASFVRSGLSEERAMEIVETNRRIEEARLAKQYRKNQ